MLQLMVGLCLCGLDLGTVDSQMASGRLDLSVDPCWTTACFHPCPRCRPQEWKTDSKHPHTIHGNGIFTYIFVDFMGFHVGKYAIHGWYGIIMHLSPSFCCCCDRILKRYNYIPPEYRWKTSCTIFTMYTIHTNVYCIYIKIPFRNNIK